MKKISINGKLYSQISFETEEEFENEVVVNEESIFGHHGIYVDIKKKVGKKLGVAGVPDGYYLDLKYHEKPTLYMVENELNVHDLFKHISDQMMRFIVLTKTEKEKIKDILIDELSDKKYENKLHDFFKESNVGNLHHLIDQVVFKNDIRVIIIIDEINEELITLSKAFAKPIELIEFQTFTNGNDRIHLFDPFDDEVDALYVDVSKPERKPREVDYDSLNTIVVPAREDGFKRCFLGKDCWYSIIIGQSMLDRLEYIAAYQTKPVSAVTYYAKIKKIEPYIDDYGNKTKKFIVYFDGKAVKLDNPVKLNKENPGSAPQSCVYTSFDKLVKAKTLEDLFK